MLSRFISKPSNFRLLKTLISSRSQSSSSSFSPPNYVFTRLQFSSRFFSSSNNNNKDQFTSWNLSSAENEGKIESLFGIADNDEPVKDVFEGIDQVSREEGVANLGNAKDEKWSLAEADEEKENDLFNIAEVPEESVDFRGEYSEEVDRKEDIVDSEEKMRLEREEKELTAVLKGPNRAFGDLVAQSGITDEMLDSLIALKDFKGIHGLPPLSEIEDMRYEKSTKASTRAEIERQKQEEVAKARVRQVDEKGRAYGTGRRKCSVARVWIQPGDGQFLINDKQFDVYFPILDQRAVLLGPFSETKTLGLWDVNCTVKGGGTSGQVGAIRLGISRALQNWEPGLRPTLKKVGFLTRDPRVVERKKPGKAKARKSFQWVKR